MNNKFYYICDYTETIRSYPENYWLASIENNEIVFDSFEGNAVNYSQKELTYFFENVKAFKAENSKLSTIVNDRFAVIVETNCQYGIQYWTDWEIRNKFSENTDHSISNFISKL